MSVSLYKLIDPPMDTIEVMAPDYDVERIWLWLDENAENRLDLSRQQMRELHKALGAILGK
jgi:hypothetical protein